MQSIPSKSDSTAGANGQLPAAEYNDRNVEIEKVITKSGQALSAGITDQFSKAIFINAIGAQSMADSGSGNTITLNPVTGGSGLVPPDDYADFNGGVVCFNKSTPNTGTAVTIAPWGLSAKSLVRKDLSLPLAGDVIGTCFAKWDNSGDEWVLMRNETDTYGYEISASGAFIPVFGNSVVELDVSLGNVDISTLNLSDFIGQHIHFYAVGSGIGSIAGGNGVYVNKIFITENTGGAHLWGVSGGLYKVENGITANYASGNYNIIKYSSGKMDQNGRNIKNNGLTTAQTFVFAVPYLVIPRVIMSQSDPSYDHVTNITAKPAISSYTVIIMGMGSGTAATTTVEHDVFITGEKY